MSPDIFKPPDHTPQDKLLMELYSNLGRTLDDLPYTEDFEQLFNGFSRQFHGQDRRQVLDRLLRLRKAGSLPRLGGAWTGPLPISDADADVLQSLVRKYARTLGQRDRLPYSPDFEALVKQFNEQTGRTGTNALSQHAVWRLIARIAK